MNNKSVFDKHLYQEGLRGLKGLGSIVLALLSVFSILFSLTYIVNDYSTGYSAISSLNSVIEQYQALYFIILILVVPIFTLKTFHFLTTRNGSDFFHSIPHKKQCLLITFSASIVTWLSICILVPSLLFYGIHSIAAGRLLSLFGLFSILLHILVAALLVMSTICIACAVTGTLLTNIITTGILLFLPRLFLYAFRVLLSVLSKNIIPKNSFFFGTKCNIVVQSFLAIDNPNYYLYNFKPLLYSLILSILYFIAAAFLFNRRPSEIAMKPTLGKRLQAFFCILLGTAFSVFPIGLLVSYRLGSYIGSSTPITFYIVALYVLIVIGMGMYELLTTRRIRNLVHIIPRTLILFVINVSIILGLFAGKKIVYSYVPDKSEIKSISFEFQPYVDNTILSSNINNTLLFSYNSELNTYYDAADESDYLLYKFNQYSTDNEEIKELITSALSKQVKGNYEEGLSIRTYINSGVQTTTRNIHLSYDDYNKLRSLVLADSKFTDIYRTLPSVRKENLSISHPYKELCPLPQEDMAELYNDVNEELSGLSIETVNACVLSSDSYYNCPRLSFATNSISGNLGGRIALSPDLMPKSYQKFTNLVNKANAPTIAKHIETASANKEEYNSYMQIEAMDSDNHYSQAYMLSLDSSTYGDAKEKALLDALISLDGTTIDLDKKDTYLLELCLNTYLKKSDEKSQTSLRYVQVEKKTLDVLTKNMNRTY